MPKVIIWTHEYNPKYEAASKEIQLLFNSINYTFIHNLSRSAKLDFRERIISYCSNFYPLRIIVPILENRFEISHIYISNPEYFYLLLLRKRPIVLTYCGRFCFRNKDVDYLISRLDGINHIVVESSKDVYTLNSLGFKTEKISLIYPGIDLSQFRFSEICGEPFKILFASAPLADIDAIFYARGVKLMLDSLENLEQVRFVFLWRKKCSRLLYTLVNRLNINESSLTIINEIVGKINPFLSGVHAVIAPFTTNWATKACPHSLIEGLASGKPVLASTEVGISDLIKKEKCGVVFEPTIEGLVRAIEELKSHYHLYQSNSRRVAEKYFSKETFVKNYRGLYERLLNADL